MEKAGKNISWLDISVILYPSMFLAVLIGCGESVETDPAQILPVLKEAQRCCDGRCSGSYKGISQRVACADVFQMESCLQGNKDQCPLTGKGVF